MENRGDRLVNFAMISGHYIIAMTCRTSKGLFHVSGENNEVSLSQEPLGLPSQE
jgi:hypothetical protein